MEKLAPDQAQGSAGLYIHVPFCPKICPYCDFAVLKAPERMHRIWLESIVKEWELRSQEYHPSWRTLYFGGGTPSLLDPSLIAELLTFLRSQGDFTNLLEQSIEGNPETLKAHNLQAYHDLGFSRMTLGIQSFDAQRLKWLGRNHGPETLENCRQLLQSRSMDLGLDIIFGYHDQSWTELKYDLDKAMEFAPDHLSLYGLSIEEGTLFAQKQKKGETLTQDDAYEELFLRACEYLQTQGFEQYELSNFARAGKRSLHNQSYWAHLPYLGLGPGAHSLLGRSRYANPKNWNQWLKGLSQSTLSPSEILDDQEWQNEWIWLQLRQSHGLLWSDLGPEAQTLAQSFIKRGDCTLEQGRLKIKPGQWHRMDSIASSLMNE